MIALLRFHAREASAAGEILRGRESYDGAGKQVDGGRKRRPRCRRRPRAACAAGRSWPLRPWEAGERARAGFVPG